MTKLPSRCGMPSFILFAWNIPTCRNHRGWGYVSRDGAGSGWWLVDWPDADNHFTMGIERLTRIDIGDPRHLRLTDDRLFDCPWIYATQTGWWDLSDAETNRLREYLLRGVFLVVDDFWGPEAWEIFRRTMIRILPDQPITDIAESDAVMHVLYDIQEKEQVHPRFPPPLARSWRNGSGDATPGHDPVLARHA